MHEGPLAMRTSSVDRAIYHLGLDGVEFDESTRGTDAKGRTFRTGTTALTAA